MIGVLHKRLSEHLLDQIGLRVIFGAQAAFFLDDFALKLKLLVVQKQTAEAVGFELKRQFQFVG